MIKRPVSPGILPGKADFTGRFSDRFLGNRFTYVDCLAD